MAEILVRDGSWTFDGDTVRVVPARERGVHKLRQLIGELAVPLQAVAGIAYEPARKGGKLRMRLREGADPFTQAAAGKIPDAGDPYQLTVDQDRAGVAAYFVDEVRNSMIVEQVPAGPSDRYLMPGPNVPLTANGGDGLATFDGESVRLEWNWMADEGKSAAGPQQFALKDLIGVEWIPATGLENGHVRFLLRSAPPKLKPQHDPHVLRLWGMDKETRTIALLVTAIVARLPHPLAPAVEPAAIEPAVATGDDHDAMLRRLRELGALHKEGVLTDEEFALAKQALLRRM